MTTEEPDPDNPILISALEHYGYCPRQCALIHREQTYDENIFTLQGNAVHERVDRPGTAVAGEIRSEYAVPLWSTSLGVVGKADLVEFRGDTPYPVEYKHGPARRGTPSELQLCAQAMCLEEMLGLEVPKGAIYHHSSRRRREVLFTDNLRGAVEQAVTDVRRILSENVLPQAPADSRCRNCSLIESCLPFVVSDKEGIQNYHRLLFSPTRIAGE